MKQNELGPAPGSRRGRKRVGRGDGSGHGTYSGRGMKGQKSRSGGNKMRPGFEGGQLPITKRLPQKRGFTNVFRREYAIVNVGQLNVFPSGTEVTRERLVERGLIKSLRMPVKVLGDGELHASLVVKVDKFSAAARALIEAVGGRAEEVDASQAG